MEKDKKELNDEELEKVTGGLNGLNIKAPYRQIFYDAERFDHNGEVAQKLLQRICPHCNRKTIGYNSFLREFTCGHCGIGWGYWEKGNPW